MSDKRQDLEKENSEVKPSIVNKWMAVFLLGLLACSSVHLVATEQASKIKYLAIIFALPFGFLFVRRASGDKTEFKQLSDNIREAQKLISKKKLWIVSLLQSGPSSWETLFRASH